MKDSKLLQETEVFQGVDMCKGKSQSIVTIRIDGEEVNLYGQFAAHYDALLRDKTEKAQLIVDSVNNAQEQKELIEAYELAEVALHKKLGDNCCACSYDNVDHVCDVHAPQLKEALNNAQRYKEALEAVVNFGHVEDCDAGDFIPIYECCCYDESQWDIAENALKEPNKQEQK